MSRRFKRAKQRHQKKTAALSASVKSNVQSLMQQAVIFHKAGNLRKAENIYLHILKKEPNNSDALHLLGVIAYQEDKLDTALNLIEKAIQVNSKAAAFHCDRGNVLKKYGRLSEAIGAYEKAIQITPNLIEAKHNLANTYRVLGNFEEAVSWYKQILVDQPFDTDTHRNLSNLIRHIEYDDDMKAMEDLLSRDGLSIHQRIDLQFGLGKSFEDIGNYEKAFQSFKEGNRLKRKTFNYDISAETKNIENLIKSFNKSLFEKFEGCGYTDNTPIFIVGMPRSGTTLVEQILASHPEVFGAGELEVFQKTIHGSIKKPIHNYSEEVSNLTPKDLDQLGSTYINNIRKIISGAKHVTDKMPHNFLLIGLIKLTLPLAKIIHCVRSPLDTCFSCYKNYFTYLHKYTFDLVELGTYYNLYAKLMSHWHKMLPGFILDVKYEELLNDQVNQTKRLLDFCGLEWKEECLEFHQTKRPVHTASAVQVRQPLYKSSIALWKRYEKQLAPLNKVLGQSSF